MCCKLLFTAVGLYEEDVERNVLQFCVCVYGPSLPGGGGNCSFTVLSVPLSQHDRPPGPFSHVAQPPVRQTSTSSSTSCTLYSSRGQKVTLSSVPS